MQNCSNIFGSNGTGGETFYKDIGSILQPDQNIWEEKYYGTKSATFYKDMGQKMQQKKLRDQKCTWTKKQINFLM